jgi:hypothetical protein
MFPLVSVSRPALEPTHPPVKWVPGVLSPGIKRGRGMTLTTHPHLVSRSRISGSYISSPPHAFMACSGTALALTSFSGPLVRTSVKRCVLTIAGSNSCLQSSTFVKYLPESLYPHHFNLKYLTSFLIYL